MEIWHASSREDILSVLKSDISQGLSNAVARDLIKHYGLNKLTETERLGWLRVLLRQFTNLLILILVGAAVLSYFLGDTIDAFAILAIVLLNGGLGFIQEWKAETAIRNLRTMLAPHCQVIREGKTQEIETCLLVPGDIVLLEIGQAVPADLRLIDAINLKADESALTGESLPVDKNVAAVSEDTPLNERQCMAWMGTHIVNGSGQGVVVATGMDTEFGRIAGLTDRIQETQTRLQRQLAILARQLTLLVIGVIVAVVAIGYMGGQPLLHMLMAGIALAVSAIPEGLPAVVTITLALGVRVLARRKALLRYLQTAETLGATSVICTDKTGTLTKNEMTIQKLWLGSGEIDISGVGYEPEGTFKRDNFVIDPINHSDLKALLRTGSICNHARIIKAQTGWTAIGSPTEAAFITAAKKAGLSNDHGDILCEFSFNSDRKRMSVVEICGDTLHVHVKGAPEVLLARADKILIDGEEKPLDENLRCLLKQAYEGFAQQGLRTLALAQKTLKNTNSIDEDEAETSLTYIGIAGIIDPPRAEAKEALAKTVSAGIRVIMITGDSPDTAIAIARQIDLDAQRAITGTELSKMSDEDVIALFDQNVIFARTVPEDKYRLVKLLQAKGHLVAMTGDGVNDAPALKQADIGIAMGIRGTDVAKGAADIVLSDDNFSSIVGAIEEGRRQYANIRKFVRYLTSSNVGETVAVFINILLGMPLILYPLQILWINLVTDSVTALSLSVEKTEHNVMDEPPRAPDQAILGESGLIMLGLYGTYIGLSTLLLYGLYVESSYAMANTLAFTVLVILSNILVLNFRSFDAPLHKIGWLSNPWLITAVISMISLQIIVLYTPFMQNILNTVALGWKEWGLVIATTIPMILISELYKTLRYKNA